MRGIKGMSRQGMITAAVLALIVFGFLFGLVGPAVLGTGSGLLGGVWTRVSGGLTDGEKAEVQEAVRGYMESLDYEGRQAEEALRRIDDEVGPGYWTSPAGKNAQQLRAVLKDDLRLRRDITLQTANVTESSRRSVEVGVSYTIARAFGDGDEEEYETSNTLQVEKVEGEWKVVGGSDDQASQDGEQLSSFDQEALEERSKEYIRVYRYRGDDPEELYEQFASSVSSAHWDHLYGEYLRSDATRKAVEGGEYFWAVPAEAFRIRDYAVREMQLDEEDQNHAGRVLVEYRLEETTIRQDFYVEKFEDDWKVHAAQEPYLINPAGPLEGDDEQGTPQS